MVRLFNYLTPIVLLVASSGGILAGQGSGITSLSCGPKQVPYAVSTDEFGAPSILCQDSPCVFRDRHSEDYANENDRAVCNTGIREGRCTGDNEWTAGLYQILNSTHVTFKSKCCTYSRLTDSYERKSSIMQNNNQEVGGITKLANGLEGFDLVKEVELNVNADGTWFYVIHWNFLLCKKNGVYLDSNTIQAMSDMALEPIIPSTLNNVDAPRRNEATVYKNNYQPARYDERFSQKSVYSRPTQMAAPSLTNENTQYIETNNQALEVMAKPAYQSSSNYQAQPTHLQYMPQLMPNFAQLPRAKAAGGSLFQPGGGCGGGCGAPSCDPCAASGGSGGSSGGMGGTDLNSAFGSMQCFSADMTVTTPTGTKRMDEINIGDSVMSIEENVISFNRVIGFLHRKTNTTAEFRHIHTNSKQALKLTEFHLIYKSKCQAGSKIALAYAKDVEVGDCVYTLLPGNAENKFIKEKITAIETVTEVGIFSPLTTSGDIIVNNVLVSCHSNFAAQALQQTFFKSYQSVANFFSNAKSLLFERGPIKYIGDSVSSYQSYSEDAIDEYEIPFGVSYLVNTIDMIVPVKLFM
uniref:HintN domain-containing protein n=1 Tax=Rhabditophanes sp. KR3021 TaxID=114890 RepID=A0AC35U4X5_9BILA